MLGLVRVVGVLMEETFSAGDGGGVRANHDARSVDVRGGGGVTARAASTPPHRSENVVPSLEPVDGWRCTVMQAITPAAATVASAM